MDSQVELVSDGESLAVIGKQSDVERFFLSSGLDRATSRTLTAHKLWAAADTASSAGQTASDFAANSGRWVKLTKESADAVREFGLMPTDTQGVSHAVIGERGRIKKWLQIAEAPSAMLTGPFALAALSTMMQQRAMQQQMDEIVDYLEQISEKVDDILRGQKDAVLADMIGVDLIIEDALTVRDEVGHVSAVTWSKVQATSQTIARTQAYAIRELDAIAEKLHTKSDASEIAKATAEAETKVREWLAVLARTLQLQDGISVLELDRVLSASPEDLDSHRLGLAKARENRLERIGRSTAALLAQMDESVRKANAKVLFNPFDSPAAVRSSNQVAADVHNIRVRIGIESNATSRDAKRWSQAAGETIEKVVDTTSQGAAAARRFGEQTYEHAAGAFRPVDLDGDGVPDESPASAAAKQAGEALSGAATGVKSAFKSLVRRRKTKGTDAEPMTLAEDEWHEYDPDDSPI